MKWTHRIGLLAFLCLVMGLASSCQKQARLYQVEFQDRLGTTTQITLSAESEREFDERSTLIEAKLQAWDRLLNHDEADREWVNLFQINLRAAEEPLELEPELFDMLQKAQVLDQATDGAFRITAGTLNGLWRQAYGVAIDAPAMAVAPEPLALAEARDHMDSAHLKLDVQKRSVQLTDPLLQLDLRDWSRGYVADAICALLESEGVTSALVNVGGHLRTIGTKAPDQPWTIAIQNPALALERSLAERLSVDVPNLMGRELDGRALDPGYTPPTTTESEETSAATEESSAPGASEPMEATVVTTVATAQIPSLVTDQPIDRSGEPVGRDDPYLLLELKDRALVTRTIDEAFFLVEGRLYHSVLDLSTGFPATGFQSISVIAPTAAEASAYATALHSMTLKEGQAWAQTKPGIEVLWIDVHGGVHRTKHFDQEPSVTPTGEPSTDTSTSNPEA